MRREGQYNVRKAHYTHSPVPPLPFRTSFYIADRPRGTEIEPEGRKIYQRS